MKILPLDRSVVTWSFPLRRSWRLVWLLNVVGCSATDEAARSGAALHVAEELSVEIASSETDPDQVLLGVRGVVRQSNGDLIVANRGSESLLAYDSLGNDLAEIGRSGEGPGEFVQLDGLGTCAADTIAVWSRGRVSIFDPNREFVRSIPTIPDGDAMRSIAGISSDCSTRLVVDRMPQLPGQTLPHVMRWLPEEGEARTLREFPGRPMASVVVAGRQGTLGMPFGAAPVWATNGDVVYLGLADRPEVLILDNDGAEVGTVRWDAAPRPVADQDRSIGKRVYEDTRALNPESAPLFPRWEDVPLADTKPFYAGLLVDDEGGLWVRDYPDAAGGQLEQYWPSAGSEPETWLAFSKDGGPRGSVEMPSGFELLAVASGYAIGIFRDELDVEAIRLYRLLDQ